MIKFELTRKVHNEHGVFGELRCEEAGIRCATVERLQVPVDWKSLTATQRQRYCIPACVYSMKYESNTDLSFGLLIKGTSTWSRMRFSNNNRQEPNTIKVGVTATADGRVVKGDCVLKQIDNFLHNLLIGGRIPACPVYGYIELSIRYDDDYHEGDYEPYDLLEE